MPTEPLAMSREKNKAWLRRHYPWLLWLLVAAVVIMPRVLDLDVFYARDELAIWPWADIFTLALWEGDPAGTLTDSDYPGIPMFWAQALFLTLKYNLPSLFPNTMIPLDMLFEARSIEFLAERRLVVGLFVSGQILGAVWLVRRLFNWPVALMSTIFMGLDPFGLTEARVLRLEMISAYFVCLTVLTYFLYLRQRQRRWLLLSGIMAGLGVSSKTSAGLVVPYIWLLLLADFLLADQPASRLRLQPTISSFKRMVTAGLTWAAGAIGAFWLIWPAMWVKPFEALEHLFVLGFVQAAERSVWGDKVFFWGQVWPGDPGPFFYPVVLAFRTTPLTWLGLLFALLFLGRSLLKFKGLTFQPSTLQPFPAAHPQAALPTRLANPSTLPTLWGFPWPAASIILLLLAVITLMLELTFIISKVDRFLLILFPLLNILSAVGLTLAVTWLAGRLQSTGRQVVMRRLLGVSLFVAVLALQLAATMSAHPYYFTYWNPWAGGGRAAMALLPMGTGEGIDLAMDYLNRQPNAAESTVICGASKPWCEHTFAGRSVRSAQYASGEWVTADYATFYISHLQRRNNRAEVVDFFMAQNPLTRIEFQGATYVWVYAVPDMGHFAGAWNDLVGLGRLLGYDFGPPERKAGETVASTVWWTNTGAGVDNVVVRWLDESGYEWGRARVDPRPEYASIPAQEKAVVSGTATFTIPPGTPPGLYYVRIGVVEPGTDQLLGEFEMPDETSRLVVQPGRIFSDPDRLSLTIRLERPLAPEITLLGYDPPDRVLTAKRPAWLTLYWQATAPPPDYRVVLRLFSAAGQEVDRWEGRPAQGNYPTSRWSAGEIVQDVWPLQVDPDLPVGRYNLELSLHQAAGNGPDSGNVVIPNVELWPQPITYDLPDMQAELQADFGDQVTLLGYDLYFDTDGSGTGRLSPVFYWQSRADFEGAFDLLLSLRADASGEVVKSWQVPLGDDQAKRFWKENEIVTTIYQFEAGSLVGGRYHLDVALENQATGKLEPVKMATGQATTFARIENIQDKIVVRVKGQQ